MTKAGLFSSSLGRKLLMAITGLFLCTFLIAHLSGNFLLFSDDAGLAFNAYAKFMTTFPLIRILSIVTYVGILIHVVDGIMLTLANRKARPVGYAKAKSDSSWASKNMAILGTIVLFFLIIHMKGFWYEMHWGEIGMDANGNKDIYTIVAKTFTSPVYVLVYMAGLIGLAIHLIHGLQSGFQTLGLNHPRYSPMIKMASLVFGIIVPVLFASMPLYFFFMQ